ncbi:procyclic form-specific polypeptide-like [Saccostrea echinata]|uniref:procyclic form-specific polypeptide-like n=1 Tax=Saccostrea echinata TaxID=191078 RepID=UPI002A812FDE|nr:procyclic form-specific polypeptide-like [Saccostrea echinata]
MAGTTMAGTTMAGTTDGTTTGTMAGEGEDGRDGGRSNCNNGLPNCGWHVDPIPDQQPNPYPRRNPYPQPNPYPRPNPGCIPPACHVDPPSRPQVRGGSVRLGGRPEHGYPG